MKRCLSTILIAAFMLCIFPSAIFAANNAKVIGMSDFKASKTELTTDSTHELFFSVDVKTQTAGKSSNVSVTDDAGNIVAKLNDNGKYGDVKSGDGIYSAKAFVYKTEKTTVKYTAIADGIISEEFEVLYYHMITDEELSAHESFWAEAEQFEKHAEEKTNSYEQKLKAMYAYISTNDLVDKGSIVWENNYSFTFNFVFGVSGFYACYELSTDKETQTTDLAIPQFDTSTKGNNTTLASWENPNVLVFRPYWSSGQSTFYNEFYTGIAADICDVTGGSYVDRKDSQASPGNLKDIVNYGFFIIDSHGQLSGGKSYMVMQRGNTDTYDYAADISAGHIITMGSYVGVTGSFFTKYIKNENKTLPDTLVYLVICHGLQTNTISSPMINCGAQLVVGYDESVTFTYDFLMSETVWKYMTTENPDTPGFSYTFKDAMQLAKQRHGNYDMYSQDRAVMTYQGNGDFMLMAEPYAPIENVIISHTEHKMYTNQTVQLGFTVEPSDTTGYEASWESSDTSVATVDDSGKVFAHNAGTATITLTVTDKSPNSLSVETVRTCEIECLGKLHVTGIELKTHSLELYAGSAGEYISATVIPVDASNKNLLYASNDTSVVTVNSMGLVTPVSTGTTTVTVTTADGGFCADVTCVVTEADFLSALNIAGGTYEFETTQPYPFISVIDPEYGRACVASSNAGVDNSYSEVIFDVGNLAAGSYITFDWMVSSELGCDKFLFYVNGTEEAVISGVAKWTAYKYEIPTDGEYTFKWTYKKDFNEQAHEDTAWLDNIDLYKMGELHTVTFLDMDRETVLATVEVEHGTRATAPDVPVHAGYVFTGWSKSIEAVRSDMTVYAMYKLDPNASTYTVSFVTSDGKIIEVQQVAEGGTAIAPEAPEIEGYVFIGWDTSFENVTEDITVTAVYAQIGDVNVDGTINTGDAVFVLRHVAELITFEGELLAVADFNGDGTVNTADATAILVYVASV